MPVSSHVRKESRRAGYCSPPILMKLIPPVTRGEWHEGDQITVKMLQEDLNIHRSEVYLVQTAARFLLFLDSQNCVTDTLVRLAHASQDEYRIILKGCIKHAYPDIYDRFDGIDLAHVPPREIKQAFTDGNYEPSAKSLRPKVISLYKALCRQAGLLSDESAIDEDMTPQESSEHVDKALPVMSQETSTSDALQVVEGNPLMVEPPSRSQMNGSLPTPDYSKAEKIGEILMSLFELPKKPGWTEEEDRTWWRIAVSSKAEEIARLTKEHGGMKP